MSDDRASTDQPEPSSTPSPRDPSEQPTEIVGEAQTTLGPRDARPSRIGPYVIEGPIGRGGMGVVWRGRDERLDRPVALKTIGQVATDTLGLRRFLREARLLARLSHPHVATIHDLPRHEGRPVLVMELLDGESLLSRLGRGPLSVGETLRLGVQVASALGAAHEHQIVHRDLKPANIQITESGDIKVLDFGVAQVWTASLTDDAEPRVVAGTPGYMSPEQLRGSGVDGRSDLFSLGIVLYECLTGERCFGGCGRTEHVKSVLLHEPDWSFLPEDAPEGLRSLLRACLSVDAATRPESAQLVRNLLLRELRRFEPSTDDASPSPPPSSLPAEHDEFIGREAELASLARLLESGTRLITVLGPGGVGKTRLVTRHAWCQLAEHPGGAWFCDLSDAQTVDGITHAVARTLDVPLMDEPIEQLGHVIASRGRCLIVLDNFEQVVAHAGATVGRWLERAPEARFIVTSRILLGLLSEEVMQVEPLDVGGAGVELFELRARAKRAEFAVDSENRSVVEDVVRLLDGLPLAIELAAARVRVLSPSQLVERMRDRFRLLTGGPGMRERQATLRAAIDWSWDLLEPWERAALAQASVFEGGLTLEAAEAVLDLSAFPEAPWPLDAVQTLVDKSLLRAWTPDRSGRGEAAGTPRFEMYESIREYAAEKLRTDGAVSDGASGSVALEAAIGRHGEHFASLGSVEALKPLGSHGGVGRWQELELDLENLLAACRRAMERDDGATALGTYAALAAVLHLSGPHEVACELGRRVADSSSLDEPQRGRALAVLGSACRDAGHLEESERHFSASLELHREVGDRASEGYALGNLAAARFERGDAEGALELIEQELAIQRDLGDRRAEAVSLSNKGPVQLQLGRAEEGRACLEQALVLHREVGDRTSEGIALGHLGMLHWQHGRLEEARAHYESALAIHHEVGHRSFVGSVTANLGFVHAWQGRPDEAQEHFESAVAIHRETGDRRSEGIILGNLGFHHWKRGHAEEALACYETALEIDREVGDKRSEGVVLGYLGTLQACHGRLDQAFARYESALNIFREVGDRSFEAVALANLGSLHAREGRLDEAFANVEQALAIHGEMADRRLEGIALRHLGDLHALQERADEARQAFDAAETILREMGDPYELGKLLAARVLLDARSGSDTETAHAFVAEAESLAKHVGAGPESDLSTALTAARAALAERAG